MKKSHALDCCAVIVQHPHDQNLRPWFGPGRFVTLLLALVPQKQRPSHLPDASNTPATPF
mgnify:CR=1 FL=1